MNNNNDKRTKLNFICEVKTKFSFLINNYGYIVTYEDDYLVKYEAKKTYFEIYHEKISYEITAVFSLKVAHAPDVKINIFNFLEANNVIIENNCFQASTKESVEFVISKLSYLVKTYAKDLLLGDIPAFTKTQSHEKNKLEILKKQHKIREIEKKAQEAWEQREYRTLITLYSSILDDLDVVQKHRLAYSKHKTKQ